MSQASRAVSRAAIRRGIVMQSLIRYVVYTIAAAASLGLLMWSVQVEHIQHLGLFKESGPVEWCQFGLLIAAATIFLVGARRFVHCRPMLLVLACLSLIAASRELDSTLDTLIPLLGWKLPALTFVAAAAVVIWRSGDAFWRQVGWWMQTPAAAMLWTGFLLVVIFAQFIGQADFWQVVMGDAYDRTFKRALEELSETFGYTVILIGTVEAMFQAGRLNVPLNRASARTSEAAVRISRRQAVAMSTKP